MCDVCTTIIDLGTSIRPLLIKMAREYIYDSYVGFIVVFFNTTLSKKEYRG